MYYLFYINTFDIVKIKIKTIFDFRDYKDHSNRNKDTSKSSLRKDDTTLSTPVLNNEFVIFILLEKKINIIIFNLGYQMTP